MNARRHLSSGENGMIFHFICCKDALKKVNKIWIGFLTPGYELWINYVDDASNEKNS